MSDLFDENGDFYSFQAFQLKYDIEINCLEYYGIIHAIPRNWVATVRRGEPTNMGHKYLICKFLKSTNKKLLYVICISRLNVNFENRISKWEIDLGIPITKDIFLSEFSIF